MGRIQGANEDAMAQRGTSANKDAAERRGTNQTRINSLPWKSFKKKLASFLFYLKINIFI